MDELTEEPGGYEEAPFYCPGRHTAKRCQLVVGMEVFLHGRSIGLRMPFVNCPDKMHLVNYLQSVCPECNEPIFFSVSLRAQRQILLELQALNML